MAIADSAVPLSADSLPKAVRKRLRGLAHHLFSWQQALRETRAHLDKDRFDPALVPHLQHCFAALPDAGDGPSQLTVPLFLPPNDLVSAVAGGTEPNVAMSPAGRALLHLPGLRRYWIATLRGSLLDDLHLRLPRAWVVDPKPLPPSSAIGGLDIARWSELYRMRESGRAFEVGGAVVAQLSGDTPIEEWRVVGAAIETESPGTVWVSELPPSDGIRMVAHYASKDGRWELVSLEDG